MSFEGYDPTYPGGRQATAGPEQAMMSYLKIHGREVISYLGWGFEMSYVDVKAKAPPRSLEKLVFQVAWKSQLPLRG